MKYFGKKDFSDNPLYWQIRDRSFGVYTEEEQERLQKASACVIGLGCVGELEAVMLARIGVGKLTIIDYDYLEVSNLNRNPYATMSLLGRSKVDNMEALLRDIDSSLQVQKINRRLTIENGLELINGHDILLQAIDHIASRIAIHRCAKRAGIPCVTMSGAPPFRAIVTTISPDGVDYEEFFDFPTRHIPDEELSKDQVQEELQKLKRKRVEVAHQHGAVDEWADLYLSGEREIWAVTPQRPYMTSILAVQEAVKWILKKEPRVVAPDFLSIDLDRIQSPVVLMNKQQTRINFASF
ncbi:MAG: ThiF family adenylyltransferase [Candidatus Marinimicrobia bacterium]|nr:ThiF family adenylyltransferase [Candidatus Neomarinimicrobiota bacterium]